MLDTMPTLDYHHRFGNDTEFTVKEDATKVTNQIRFQEIIDRKENEQESVKSVYGLYIIDNYISVTTSVDFWHFYDYN